MFGKNLLIHRKVLELLLKKSNVRSHLTSRVYKEGCVHDTCLLCDRERPTDIASKKEKTIIFLPSIFSSNNTSSKLTFRPVETGRQLLVHETNSIIRLIRTESDLISRKWPEILIRYTQKLIITEVAANRPL